MWRKNTKIATFFVHLICSSVFLVSFLGVKSSKGDFFLHLSFIALNMTR